MAEPASIEVAKRIAVVTGANKGIGLEICRQLASHGVMVILTARDVTRGTEAVEKLKNSGASDVLFHQLDVADPSSIASLADFLEKRFGKLDILINNAGVSGVRVDTQSLAIEEGVDEYVKVGQVLAVSRETNDSAAECVNINYYGVKRVTEALIPLLQRAPSPKTVNTASTFGLLSVLPSESLRKKMGDVDEKTETRLDEVLQSYLNELKEGKIKEDYWPNKLTVYKLSKVALNTYTRFLANKYPTVCINGVHPGFVRTDISCNIGEITAEEGAKGPVTVALLPEGSPSGLFYNGTEVSSFE